MTSATNGPASRKPLRVWPGAVLATVLVIGRYVLPRLAPDAELFAMPLPILGVLAGMFGALGIVIWWVFFSRATWLERLGVVVLMAAALFALKPLVHPSISGGMMGNMLTLFAVPVLSLAIVGGAFAVRRRAIGVRVAGMAAAIVLASMPFLLIRTAGTIGAGAELHWRWTPTPEERLVARGDDEPPVTASAPPAAPPVASTATEVDAPREKPLRAGSSVSTTLPPRSGADATDAITPATPAAPRGAAPVDRDPVRAEWPGFRGPRRDSVVRGVRINTDWSTTPPVEMWRRPVGPGWSSFAVSGDRIYTQEQRGDDEMVSCYRLATGEPLWRHRDPVRFWESNAGAGPRATPTVHDDRVYAFGATGILNALDATNGTVLWSRNAAAETGVEIPVWGFASSPLVMDDLVVIAVSGQLVAYDVRTGARRWVGPEGGSGYSSPHLVTLDGVPQILLLRGSRTVSVAPADGKLLWEHTWQPGVGIVQPGLTPDNDVLITVADAMGGIAIRRVAVTKGPSGWSAQERWTSRGLKPYFNDFVVHEGHAFGFDGSILSAVDITDGTRKWKGGRYGNGQMILLPEQDVLLVISEEGELALVSATPDQYKELARFPVLNAKTWNHPVVVRDVVLVRNGEEMAAFRLPLSGR